jgi:hypothetical protein
MTRPIPLENKKWLDVKGNLSQGGTAYYVERGGYYDIIVPDAMWQCQIPTLATFEEMPPDMAIFFNRHHITDFETNYKHILLRSKLSDPEQ